MRLVPDKSGKTKTLIVHANPVKKIRWLEYKVYVNHGSRTEVRQTYFDWRTDGDVTQMLRMGHKLGATHIQCGPTRFTL